MVTAFQSVTIFLYPCVSGSCRNDGGSHRSGLIEFFDLVCNLIGYRTKKALNALRVYNHY